MYRLLAFDLDGTLTQHKTPLEPRNRAELDRLGQRYKLLMVGAGQCMRIFNQMRYPIDIIGNYGMQYGEYDAARDTMNIIRDDRLPCDRASVEARAAELRSKYGFTEFAGDSVEFHPSGCVTIALLGTKADPAAKLAFDPDRSRRRAIYSNVVEMFPEYTVFVGGTSSFDMAPRPYDKYYALSEYCREHGYEHSEVAYVGDDYGPGGNDESVAKSDIRFIRVDDYRRFADIMSEF